jgi:four helix bundle protein
VSGTSKSVSGKREENCSGMRNYDPTASASCCHHFCMRDHRSIHAWQEARAVVLGTIRMSRDKWKPYASALFEQLQRASLSVQLNIAEGYAYADSPSFTRHLAIAYSSAIETGELLELLVDAEIVGTDSVGGLLTSNQRSQRLLLGLLRSRRRKSARRG